MYETRLSRMTMQLPLAQMANRDGEAGMETMLWDINVIPNEQDNGYLMLPPGVLHMSALGRFGRFTLFSPRVSHSKHLPCSFCFVLCFGFGVFVALLCFCFLFCKCFGIPNSPRSLDLDGRQGLIASSAMQQKKKVSLAPSLAALPPEPVCFADMACLEEGYSHFAWSSRMRDPPHGAIVECPSYFDNSRCSQSLLAELWALFLISTMSLSVLEPQVARPCCFLTPSWPTV